MNTPDIDRLSLNADRWRREGSLSRACAAFEEILAANPDHPSALRGRARVALSRGEDAALERFDHALKVDPGNGDLWLGKAQALDAVGNTNAALQIAQQLANQAPGWLEGMRFLAQLRLARGEHGYADHYEQAVRKAPQDPNIWLDWANQLAGTDRFADAAEISAQARKRFPREAMFALLQATHASAAGQLDQADELFASLELDSIERRRSEARHRIRRKEFAHAETLLNDTIAEDITDIASWALLGLVWRAIDDQKSDWLHGQVGLYGIHELAGPSTVCAQAAEVLHKLHDQSSMPIGQSLRGGTQTRGNLFDRLEPEFGELRRAIQASLKTYQDALPISDLTHPILLHRNSGLRLAGSWSVRLRGGGDYHTSHIHPSGVLSSALYLEVPSERSAADPQAGCLELGRPPPDLLLDLEPIAVIEPVAGCLALFPSFLYHGTRAFERGQRMSVAFDVIAED